jgi:hypothetical protein
MALHKSYTVLTIIFSISFIINLIIIFEMSDKNSKKILFDDWMENSNENKEIKFNKKKSFDQKVFNSKKG